MHDIEHTLKSFDGLIARCIPYGDHSGLSACEATVEFLCRHPYLFFHHGYDEARVFFRENKASHDALDRFYKQLSQNRKRGELPFKGGLLDSEMLLHHANTGTWRALYHVWALDTSKPVELGILDIAGDAHPIEVTTFVDIARRSDLSGFMPDYRVIFSPSLVECSIPRSQILVSSLAHDVIHSLQEGHLSIAELKPRDLEEVVAELLGRHGLKVHLTPRTRDGGRDVVASGEFFPGFLSVLAVEVTSARTVGISKLAMTAYRNRHYPTLMMATSGRFSAGVIKEQRLAENRLRMVLADGDCLTKWINTGSPKLMSG